MYVSISWTYLASFHFTFHAEIVQQLAGHIWTRAIAQKGEAERGCLISEFPKKLQDNFVLCRNFSPGATHVRNTQQDCTSILFHPACHLTGEFPAKQNQRPKMFRIGARSRVSSAPVLTKTVMPAACAPEKFARHGCSGGTA
jgi:hypothetical protein